MNPVSLMANAGKLSVSQLQQAVKDGTVPAYIGIPMMQEKIKQAKQAQPAQAPKEPPIAQQVMAEASGIDQMPSNLPVATAKDGGIVSFADGGNVEDFDQEAYEEQQDEAEYAQAIEDSLNAAEQGGAAMSSKPADVNRTPNVEGGIKSNHKGYDEHAFVRGVSGSHKGIDYAMPVGTPISPKVEGTLRYNTRDKNGWGNAAEIVGDNGQVLQRFAHLSKFEAPEGSRVKPGQVIAMSGNTGRSTGPHLHVENFYADGGIARLNNGGVPRFNKDGLVDDNSFSTSGLSQYNRLSKPVEPVKQYGSEVPEQPASDLLYDNTDTRTDKDRRLDAVIQELATYDALGNYTGTVPVPKRNPYANTGISMAEYQPSIPPIPAGAVGHGMPDYQPGLAPLPKEKKTNAEINTNTETSSVGNSSGRSSGEKQKSEYDLIREDIMNQREELKRQKQEDKYMAILQAGLGMMGGTSPNAMANIGQGASLGIAQYGASGKQRAAENAALNKGLLSAQRYKSMDEYQRAALADRAAGRTELAGYRADERADRNDLKQFELDARKERDIATMITNGASRVTAELKARFPNPEFAKKGEYESVKSALEAQFIAPYVKMQNNLLKSRYPDVFNETNPVRPAASSNRVQFGSL